jgi:hypothetical protein
LGARSCIIEWPQDPHRSLPIAAVGRAASASCPVRRSWQSAFSAGSTQWRLVRGCDEGRSSESMNNEPASVMGGKVRKHRTLRIVKRDVDGKALTRAPRPIPSGLPQEGFRLCKRLPKLRAYPEHGTHRRV